MVHGVWCMVYGVVGSSLVANLSEANHFKLEFLQSAAMEPVLAAAKFFYIEGESTARCLDCRLKWVIY